MLREGKGSHAHGGGNVWGVIDCPTQPTFIFMILYLYLSFGFDMMANTKVTNMHSGF